MEMSVLPPGFRFHPTDEELVAHYLKRKATGRSLEEGIIAEIDIYKFEPSELPSLSILASRDPEWYFFNLQDRKYLHGSRTNRTTKAGYWKATGKDRKISTGNQTVGMKKTLIYYRGRAPNGERTDWVMHEYRLDEEFEKRIGGIKNPFVLCRVRRKQGPGPRNGEQYGAPVLEDIEDDEDNLGHVKDVLSMECYKDLNVEIGSKPPSQVPGNGSSLVDNMEDLDYFLDTLASFQEEPGSIDDGFDFQSKNNDEFNFVDSEGKLEPIFDSMPEMHGNPIENLHSMLHRAENEADMLEELLHEIVDGGEIVDEPIEYSNDGTSEVDVNAEQGFMFGDYGDFFELADLQDYNGESVSDLSSLELSDTGFGDNRNRGIETQVDAEWVPESLIEQGSAVRRVRLQLDVPEYEFKQVQKPIILNLKHRAQEVLSDESRIFSDTNYSQSLVNSENPSADFITDLLSTSEMSTVDRSTAVSLQTSSSLSQDLVGILQEQKDTEASNSQFSMLSSDQSNTDEFISSISNPLSPASLLRVVLGYLENVPVLPASALELSSATLKLQNTDNMNKRDSHAESSLNVIRPVLHQRMVVKQSNKLSEADQSSKLSESDRFNMLSEYDQASSECKYEGGRRAPCKGCRSSGMSIFLFSLATSALILFCLFRGFFKFTRSAFAVVL